MEQLFDAIQDGRTLEIEQLLTECPNLITAKNEIGNTALHEAVRLGNSEAVSYLLTHGADSNAIGDLGNRPLHYAVESEQDPALAETLIKHGAKIELANHERETPLQRAARQNRATAEVLIKHGAHVDLNSAVLLGRVESVAHLLSADPALSTVTFPQYLIRQAIMSGSEDILRMLLTHGIKPNSLALFEALTRILNGLADINLLRLLLTSGADPNSRLYGTSGDSAVDYARRFRGPLSDQVVQLLQDKSHEHHAS